MKLNITKDRLVELAKDEAGCDITAGGLLATLSGGAPPAHPVEGAATADIARDALATLIQFQRRRMKLSAETLAERAELDVGEVLAVELTHTARPEPRVLSKLARVLKLPAPRLLALSGWGAKPDQPLAHAAFKFAARSSAPTEPLSREEAAALDDFVRFLATRTTEAEER